MPPKKPLETLKLTGTFRHNKGRYAARQIPAAHGELGDPPPHMSVDAMAAWIELATLAPPGLLGRTDRLAVEIASNLMAESRLSPVDFPAAKITLLQKLLGKFGMNPADRAAMRLPSPKEPSPFDEFITDPMEELLQ